MVSPINKNTVKCEHKLDLSCIYVKKKKTWNEKNTPWNVILQAKSNTFIII